MGLVISGLVATIRPAGTCPAYTCNYTDINDSWQLDWQSFSPTTGRNFYILSLGTEFSCADPGMALFDSYSVNPVTGVCVPSRHYLYAIQATMNCPNLVDEVHLEAVACFLQIAFYPNEDRLPAECSIPGFGNLVQFSVGPASVSTSPFSAACNEAIVGPVGGHAPPVCDGSTHPPMQITWQMILP